MTATSGRARARSRAAASASCSRTAVSPARRRPRPSPCARCSRGPRAASSAPPRARARPASAHHHPRHGRHVDRREPRRRRAVAADRDDHRRPADRGADARHPHRRRGRRVAARLDAGGALRVGPESAGADPGPACYGRGTAPTVTDAQLVLGRLVASEFLGGDVHPRSRTGARRRAVVGATSRAHAGGDGRRHRRRRDHGDGAGAARHHRRARARSARLHAGRVRRRRRSACRRSRRAARHATRLRAAAIPACCRRGAPWRVGGARLESQPVRLRAPSYAARCGRLLAALERGARREFAREAPRRVRAEPTLDVRYEGQSYEVMVPFGAGWASEFHRRHRRLFGHADPARPVEVGDAAPASPWRSRAAAGRRAVASGATRPGRPPGGRLPRPIAPDADLASHRPGEGCADRRSRDRLRVQRDDGRAARLAWQRRSHRRDRAGGAAWLTRSRSRSPTIAWRRSPRRWASCSGGRRRRRTSRSGATTRAPCSTRDGRLVAQAAHIPVHLGSTPLSVRAAIARDRRWRRGDVVILNDPFAGGTHLPDVTVVAPVFARRAASPFGLRRQPRAPRRHRRHDARLDGAGDARCSRRACGCRRCSWSSAGGSRDDVLALFLANMRVPGERRRRPRGAARRAPGAAPRACASCRAPAGRRRLPRRCARCRTIRRARCARRCARCRRAPTGATTGSTTTASGARDCRIAVAVTIARARPVRLHRHGAAEARAAQRQPRGHARRPSSTSSCARAGGDPVQRRLARVRSRSWRPTGSLVNARARRRRRRQRRDVAADRRRAAAARSRARCRVAYPGGQRGHDEQLALGGIGRAGAVRLLRDDRRRRRRGPARAGAYGVHTHMTNTLNTPIEALEAYYPLRVTRYALRPRSGGRGRTRRRRHRARDRVPRPRR